MCNKLKSVFGVSQLFYLNDLFTVRYSEDNAVCWQHPKIASFFLALCLLGVHYDCSTIKCDVTFRFR